MPKLANHLCNMSRDSKSSPDQDETISKKRLTRTYLNASQKQPGFLLVRIFP